jgi:hypothetical protein
MKWVVMAVVLIATVARAEEAIRPTTLPGLRIPLPAWPTLENVGDFGVGRFAVKSPDAPFRAVSVMWQRTSPMKREEVVSMLGGTAPADARPLSVGGHPGEIFTTVAVGLPMVVITWYCPVDGRLVAVAVAGGAGEPAPRRLADSLAPGIQCHTMRSESQPLPLYPPFDPPPGFVRLEKPGPAHIYIDRDEQMFSLQPALRGQHVKKGMAQIPRMREVLLVKLLGLEQARIDENPLTVGERSVWRATGLLDGKRARVLATVWECGNDSFVAHFVGYSQAATDRAVQVLARIGCPAR